MSTKPKAKPEAKPKFIVMSSQANGYGPEYVVMGQDEDEAKRLAAQYIKSYPSGLMIYKAHSEVRPTSPPVEYVEFKD